MNKTWLLAGAAAGAYVLTKRDIDLQTFYNDRGCIVTGGGSGFGLAMVQRLVELNAQVLAVDLQAERLAELKQIIPHIHTLQLDITADDAPQRILETAQATIKRIDILHNNAGIAITGPFLASTAEQISAMAHVNFLAHMQITRIIAPHMVANGRGDIAFTASLSSWLAAPSLAVYSGTKAGIKQFAHALRRELLGTGVRIETLAPNIVRTQLMPDDVFDHVAMRYGITETVEALLHGIVKGQRDIFINSEDRVLQRLEQWVPDLVDRIIMRRADLKHTLERGNIDGRLRSSAVD